MNRVSTWEASDMKFELKFPRSALATRAKLYFLVSFRKSSMHGPLQNKDGKSGRNSLIKVLMWHFCYYERYFAGYEVGVDTLHSSDPDLSILDHALKTNAQ